MPEYMKKHLVSSNGKEIKVGNLYYLNTSATFHFKDIGSVEIENYHVMMVVAIKTRKHRHSTFGDPHFDHNETFIEVFIPHLAKMACLFEHFIKTNLIEAETNQDQIEEEGKRK